MVGNAARMRASLLTVPPWIGTFRSSRINTRLSRRSRLDILVIFKGKLLLGLRPGQRRVEHAVGKSPLVVVPRANLHQRPLHDLGEGRIVGGGGGVWLEVH